MGSGYYKCFNIFLHLPFMIRKLLILSLLCLFSSCDSPYKSSKNKQEIIVAFQPYSGFSDSEVKRLEQTVTNYYGVSTTALPKTTIPQRFFINIKAPRFRADSIIKDLKRNKPDSIDYIIGLTPKDISFTKKNAAGITKSPEYKYKDWGIFGLGYRPGPSCVVSTYRIKGHNTNHTFERLQKIVLHELGHNIGLPHCPNEYCFMRDAAEKISTIDAVEMNLCDACKEKINLPVK